MSCLIHSVLHNLSTKPDVYCWTDSLTVLCWIKNNRHWKQYVQNQAQEIHKLTNKERWRFCPGVENLADLPSRSCSGLDLADNQVWWSGPEFLQKNADSWPDKPNWYESDTAQAELLKIPPAVIHSLVSTSSVQEKQPVLNLETVIDITRYSSKLRLLRITGLVLKFIVLLNSKGNDHSRELHGDEWIIAEDKWVMSIQKQAFSEEYQQLLCRKPVMYRGQFSLALNEKKLTCCKGHMGRTNLLCNMKSFVLLPTKHCFTNLLILDQHKKVHHNAIAETLASIRENY